MRLAESPVPTMRTALHSVEGATELAVTNRFTVHGKPEPLRRHRSTRQGRSYDDPKNGPYADAIRWAWNESHGREHTGTVKLIVWATFARPASHWTTRGALSSAGLRAGPPRPDVDNLVKAVMDALNGMAWRDDTQVVALDAVKRWTGAPQDGAQLHVISTDHVVPDWVGSA